MRLSGRKRGMTWASIFLKSPQVVLMGPPSGLGQRFTSFSVHGNYLKFWFRSLAWGSETDIFIRTYSRQFLFRQYWTMGNSYSFTPLQHAMEWRYMRNRQRFPTSSTCPGPQWLNSLSYCHPTSITWTPHKHLMGTDIWYPTSLNYTDTLKASLPEVSTTAYT